MATNATKIMILMLTAIPLLASAQTPDYIKKTIYRQDRSVYLMDTTLTLDKKEVLSAIHPEDTALVRTILDKGRPDEDYLGFFQRKGYRIKKIVLRDFNKLPKDSIAFSKREQRLLREYEHLSAEVDSLLSKGQMTTPLLDRKMRKRKYMKVVRKETSEYPILMGVYGIYRYKHFVLVVYFSTLHLREINIAYQIYVE